MQKKLWPLNRSIERRIPMGIAHSRCRIGRMECALGCALTGNLNPVFLLWESGLELHVFPTWVFLIIDTFPQLLEKNRATSPPESWTHPFSLEPKAGLWKPERTSCFHTIFDDLYLFLTWWPHSFFNQFRRVDCIFSLIVDSFFFWPANLIFFSEFDNLYHLFLTWWPYSFSDQLISRRVDSCPFRIDCWPHLFPTWQPFSPSSASFQPENLLFFSFLRQLLLQWILPQITWSLVSMNGMWAIMVDSKTLQNILRRSFLL